MQEEKWIMRGGRSQPLIEKYHIEPLLARILAGRLKDTGQDPESFLSRQGDLFDPFLMAGMDKASRLLVDHLSSGGTLTIVGDYDVDGMTSTAILKLGLSYAFPQAEIRCRLPERRSEGYGFALSIAKEVAASGTGMVITCDNGIREFASASYLKEKQIPLIITDHHNILKDENGHQLLPDGAAVVEPHLEGDQSPQKLICGAFVALQVVRAVYHLLGLSEGMNLMDRLISYAAIGTVCDVMPLVQQNRLLVTKGLGILNRTPACGLRQIMDVKEIQRVDTYTISFGIGPMINSGGRLGSQNHFLPILLSDDPALCRSLALELNTLNTERQEIEKKGIQEGLSMASSFPPEQMVYVVYLPDMDESIVGLVAGKIVESTHHPVFVSTKGADGVKGSGRSIEAYHMSAEMDKASYLFSRMGGHDMAAGFTLKAEEGREEQACQNMSDVLNRQTTLTQEDCQATVYLDAACDPSELSYAQVDGLSALEPFGTGNSRPLIACRHVRYIRRVIYGKKKNVMRLTFEGRRGTFTCLSFDVDSMETFFSELESTEDENGPSTAKKPLFVDLAYEASIHEYNGERSIQTLIRHIRKSR